MPLDTESCNLIELALGSSGQRIVRARRRFAAEANGSEFRPFDYACELAGAIVSKEFE